MAAAFATVASLAVTRRNRLGLRATATEVPESSYDVGDGGFDYIVRTPPGAEALDPERTIMEGEMEVKPEEGGRRPGGQSDDPNKIYYWKMSRDRRTIDVIIPLEQEVAKKDVVFRLGEDSTDPNRGPTLEVGFAYKDQQGRRKERLIVDGQILNAVNREECMWTLEEMAGVPIILVTITRPSMVRWRHDPILQRRTQEERLDPQTWDSLLFEERTTPKVTDKVFLDLTIEGEPAGRIELGLFGEILPATVKNFIGLCTGEYEDENGNLCKSAFHYKNTCFQQVLPNFLMAAGNPGFEYTILNLSNDELREYTAWMQDPKRVAQDVNQVKRGWLMCWGAGLGTTRAKDLMKGPGKVVDIKDEEEEGKVAFQRINEALEKGNGMELMFYRPELVKGVDMRGGQFPPEGFKAIHAKRGTLSMDRSEERDIQGSSFFITLKEFPEMDKRWVAFGTVLSGWELINRLEDNYENRGDEVVIADCGLL